MEKIINCDICFEENIKKVYSCRYCRSTCCKTCLKCYLNTHVDDMKIYCFNCNNLIDTEQISNVLSKEDYTYFMHSKFENQLQQLNINYSYIVDKFKKQLEIKYSSIDIELYNLYDLYHFKVRHWKPVNSRKHSNDNKSYFKVLSNLHAYVNNQTKNNKKQLKISIKSSIYSISKIVLEELYYIIKNKTDKILNYHEFFEIKNYINDKIYDINYLYNFVNDELKTTKINIKQSKQQSHSQNKSIKRCEQCEIGIIREVLKVNNPNVNSNVDPDVNSNEIIYECDNCKLNYCVKCLEKIDSNHKCDKNNIDTIKEIFKNSKPCPICATRIEKISGCNDMYCTYCKTGFKWDTYKIIKTNFHNEHRMKDIADKKLTPNLPDLLCSKFYSMTHFKRDFMRYVDEKNKYCFEKVYDLAMTKTTSYEKIINHYLTELIQNYVGLLLQSQLMNPSININYYFDLYDSFEKLFKLTNKENEINFEKIKQSICYDFLIETDQHILIYNQLQSDFDTKLKNILEIIA